MNKYILPSVIGLYLLVFIVPLQFRPLAISDESRYAEIPREMIESGDWVVPHLNGLRYFEKPPLGYWLTALSMKAFGQTNFAVRLPSALSAGFTALLIGWLVRRQTRDLSWALLSAVIYLTSILVFFVGVTGVLDGMLTLFLTAAITFFFLSDQETKLAPKTVFLALFGICCGLAFLTKGFLALAIPVIVIVPYCMWCGKWKDLFLFPVLPIVLAVGIVLPWAIAIHFREPDFWRYFFWEEHIRRFTAENAQHAEPFWYFVPVIVLGALPWSFVAPAALMGWTRKIFAESLPRFALCWLVVPFVFFSASRGELGTYILPCFPPLAILLGGGLARYFARDKHPAFNRPAFVLAGIMALCALALTATQLAPGFSNKVFAAHETRDWIVLIAGLVAWSALLVLSGRSIPPNRKFALYAAAPLFLFATFGFALPYSINAARSAQDFLTTYADRIPLNSIVVGDDKRTQTGCWFLQRKDLFVLGQGEFKYGLSYPEARYRHLEPDQSCTPARSGARNAARHPAHGARPLGSGQGSAPATGFLRHRRTTNRSQGPGHCPV